MCCVRRVGDESWSAPAGKDKSGDVETVRLVTGKQAAMTAQWHNMAPSCYLRAGSCTREGS